MYTMLNVQAIEKADENDLTNLVIAYRNLFAAF